MKKLLPINTNQNSKLKTKIGFLFAIFYLLFAVPTVFAQVIKTVTVIPPTVEQSLNPGEHVEGALKLVNEIDQPSTFTVTIQDYIVDNNSGVPHLLPPDTLSNKYSAASWIGVTPSTFTVGSRKKSELGYYIQVPSDAKPGGHYAAVIYTPVNPGGDKGSGASVNAQVGTLFYITVKGPVKEAAVVSKFSAPSFSEFGPVRILTEIQNNSDIHIRPQGFVSLFDIFGKRVETVGLKENNIFPGVARDFENDLGGKIMIGRYKATLLASYGTANNLPLSSIVYFWVFPWKIALLIILIIVAGVLGYFYSKKKGANTKDTPSETKTGSQPPQGPTVTS